MGDDDDQFSCANGNDAPKNHNAEEKKTDTAIASFAAFSSSSELPQDRVRDMIQACSDGNQALVEALIKENAMYARQQCLETGSSPLMAASGAGYLQIVQLLLEQGAPWNAVDRQQQCAGNYATDAQHWEVVQYLVDWAVRAELILGQVQRNQNTAGNSDGDKMDAGEQQGSSSSADTKPPELQSSTKPDYLQQRLQYTTNRQGDMLLDADQDAVMMEWERPLMQAHAQFLMAGTGTDQLQQSTDSARSVLNVGFGLGLIDTALQEFSPSLHIIVEAHPDVYQRMLDQKWNERPNVRIEFGTWQVVVPRLVAEGVQVDAIFFDTYGEHYTDLQDFHETALPHLLRKSTDSVYSFFNGLAPDNLFFHGVACQCVKLQLAALGMDSEFLQCEIQTAINNDNNDSMWDGVRRPYWHGRDTYYLPRCTWNPEFLLQQQQEQEDETGCNESPHALCGEEEMTSRKKKLLSSTNDIDMKRQRIDGTRNEDAADC